MQTNEIYSERSELLERVNELSQAPRKSVMSVDHNAVDDPLSATNRELCQSSPNDYSGVWLKLQTHPRRHRIGKSLADPSHDGFSQEWRFFGRLLC